MSNLEEHFHLAERRSLIKYQILDWEISTVHNEELITMVQNTAESYQGIHASCAVRKTRSYEER